MSRSQWEELAEWPQERLDALLDALGQAGREALLHDWAVQARPEQLPPPGDWRIWLMLAGRGFGKTRSGAEWVRGIAERDGRARIALVGATLHDARSVMVEGESGLLAIAPRWDRPIWHPALKRLIWKSGAQAMLFGAAEPESLRGPQFTHGWADELAKWPYAEMAWDNLMMGLRLGANPRVLVTTTPRPVPLVRRLVGQAGVALTRGGTRDNRAHLAPGFLAAMERDYGGSALGRQELNGELIDEPEGALWTRALIERLRLRREALWNGGDSPFARVVVAVDPPATSNGDACGIVVVGLGLDGLGYVIEDATVAKARPEGWAAAVAAAAARHGADRVIAEANNGGEMVSSVLRAAEAGLPVRIVHASRGKVARAEPVAALYERGRVRHVGAFPDLEDQLCGLMIGGEYQGPGRSPDRADALVWAITELMLVRRAPYAVRSL
ncbi:MAG: terminase family protein [Sphingobium sp.]|jgi:phage terminase large subunit-like protein|nr:terminase family protein [Sphingobium sp.]MCI1270815.1 terminase family protein [Sphingobium sp.]MCI1756740.1 terminase family protein [Sphingobium sp.]MCI2052326.1 terminase family protein [Sphingobium sp.]